MAVCIEAVKRPRAMARHNVRGRAPDEVGDQFLDDVTEALRKCAGSMKRACKSRLVR